MVFGGEDALLDAQFAQCDFQDLEIGDLVDHRCDGAFVVVIVISHANSFPGSLFGGLQPAFGNFG